jgi:ankyrin repeat protein
MLKAAASNLVLRPRFSAVILSATLCFGANAETATDIFAAIRSNDLATLKTLTATSANQRGDRDTTPLMFAGAFGSVDAVQLLLDAGADVNAKNALGYTALMWSVTEPAKAGLLIAHGADVNAKSRTGRTALIIAAMQNGSDTVVQTLLAKGADPLAADNDQQSFLLAASKGSNPRQVRLAVQKGADVNAKDRLGMTALMNATQAGDVDSVKFLLSKGADVNAISNSRTFDVKNGPVAFGNTTALMFASFNGPVEMVRLLLLAGAKADATDVRGMTALHMAVATESQGPEIVRLLLKAGADPTKKDNTGATPADWAAKYNHPGVVKLVPSRSESSSPKISPSTQGSEPVGSPREVTERSLRLLQNVSDNFFKTGGCVACHAQNLTAIANHYADLHGIRTSREAQQRDATTLKASYVAMRDGLLARADPIAAADSLGYALFQLSVSGVAGDTITDALVHNLAAQQLENGSWHVGLAPRAPMEDGDFSRTAFAIHALRAYEWPARRADLTTRVEKARSWLLGATPTQTEDSVMQLVGLVWAGEHDTSRFARELIARQRFDGGWSQNPNLESDAYATGQVLFALAESKNLKTTDLVFQRGIRYLLTTQKEDGSWHVKSRAPKFQPYFQSGFPHEHDQWISMAGTAWAAIALSFANEPRNELVINNQD